MSDKCGRCAELTQRLRASNRDRVEAYQRYRQRLAQLYVDLAQAQDGLASHASEQLQLANTMEVYCLTGNHNDTFASIVTAELERFDEENGALRSDNAQLKRQRDAARKE